LFNKLVFELEADINIKNKVFFLSYLIIVRLDITSLFMHV